jgi:hypothetical protein
MGMGEEWSIVTGNILLRTDQSFDDGLFDRLWDLAAMSGRHT